MLKLYTYKMYKPRQFHPASIANNLWITLQIVSSNVNIVNLFSNAGMFPYRMVLV